MHYFYSRVSTNQQDTLRQVEQFKSYIQSNAIAEYQLIDEHYSGKTLQRPKYSAMRQLMKGGDTLVVSSLDRLGRNMNQLKSEYKALHDDGIRVIILDMPLLSQTSDTLEGNLISSIVLELLAYLAQSERERISSRTKQALAAKKAEGKILGRPKVDVEDLPKDFNKYMRMIIRGELTKTQVAQILNISRPTLYRLIKVFNAQYE